MLSTMRTKWKLGEVIRLWLQYRDAVHAALEMEKPTEAHQAEFLNLKARIASRLNFVGEAIPMTVDGSSRRSVGDMLAMLQAHRSLLETDAPGDFDVKAFDHRWHESYIFLNRLRGMRLSGPQKVRRSRPVPTGVPRQRLDLVAPTRRFVVFLGKLSVLTALCWLVSLAIGVRYTGGRFSVNSPTTVSGSLENVLNGVSALAAQVDRWFDAAMPVALAYAPVAAVVAGVLLLASLGYRAIARH